MAFEAVRIAIAYMTPVVVLSDGYLANGAEPWRIPAIEDLSKIEVRFANPAEQNGGGFHPYARDERTLARPWAIPGTPGLEHRIGGLEKHDITGNVSYDPENHEKMVHLRAEKVARVAQDIPLLDVSGPESGELLIVSWGGTYGAVTTAAERLREEGMPVSHAHLRYLNPFPRNLEEVLKRFEKILVPELNLGQLRLLLRARFLVDAIGLNKVAGQPFMVTEIMDKAREILSLEKAH
jgi:2-oxoglutarate ferredoxin oxidoreductase subunit alpha